MHILHISNDFGNTAVYKMLYQNLDNLGIRQTVFVPVNPRVKQAVGSHDFEFKTARSKIVYSEVQKWYHRYLYEAKISSVVKDLMHSVDLESVDLIHTGTLCMTGAVAYEICKRVGLPFIVSVRNVDVNAYFRQMKWKIPYFNQILLAASSVVFVSPQYKKDCFEKHFDPAVVTKIMGKTVVVPNGVDEFYLSNRQSRVKEIHKPAELVYVASFDSNKNLLRLIQAISLLNREGLLVKLTAIGEGMPNRSVGKRYLRRIKNLANKEPSVQLEAYKDKEELLSYYQNGDIFVMPSVNETFGLTYIEALTQGLPVLYTKGQGFDGFFPEGFVGKSVNASNVRSIASGLHYIIKNYAEIAENIPGIKLERDFEWSLIAGKYRDLYLQVLGDQTIDSKD